MNKHSLFLLSLTALMALSPFRGAAETADAADNAEGVGFWTSVEGSTKLAKGLGLSIEAEYRMRDNFNATDRANVGFSLSYKNKNWVPWLKADAGYTFIYNNNPAETSVKYEDDGHTPKHQNVDEAYWGMKHRATFSLSGSWKAGRFKLGLRERYQYTYRAAASCSRTRLYYNPLFEAFPDDVEKFYLIDDPADPDYSYFTDSKNPKSDHKLRSRLSASYDIPKCKFEPFAEIELYNELDNHFFLDKIRYTVGTDYKISKTQKLSAYYRYQDHSDGDEMGGHVVGVSYAFDF